MAEEPVRLAGSRAMHLMVLKIEIIALDSLVVDFRTQKVGQRMLAWLRAATASAAPATHGAGKRLFAVRGE